MARPWKLKSGQWVKVQGGSRADNTHKSTDGMDVGVLQAPGDDDSMVHFVDSSGVTVDTSMIQNGRLVRATPADVPSPRQPSAVAPPA